MPFPFRSESVFLRSIDCIDVAETPRVTLSPGPQVEWRFFKSTQPKSQAYNNPALIKMIFWQAVFPGRVDDYRGK
jgi:hypothetical protein